MGSLGDVGMGAWCSLSVSVFSGEEEARRCTEKKNGGDGV